MEYTPQNLTAQDIPELREQIFRELSTISVLFSALTDFIQLRVSHVAPPRPRKGMIVYADGIDWNPGAGEGYYGYGSASWQKLNT